MKKFTLPIKITPNKYKLFLLLQCLLIFTDVTLSKNIRSSGDNDGGGSAGAGAGSGDNDNIIFARADFLDLPGYEEVTKPDLTDIGALEKCGEGEDLGVHTCVAYYMCDPFTNVVKPEGVKTRSGFGTIDIRFGANRCDHPLDVCCGVPKTTPAPIPEPTPATPVTIPPTQQPTQPPEEELDLRCGIRRPEGVDFTIKGQKDGEAEYGEFPWMAAILRSQPEPGRPLAVCGAALISMNVLLTGAHCVHMFKTGELKVRAGEWDTQTEKERLPYQERNIAEIVIHPKFNPSTLFNDVALLIVDQPFERAEHLGTICLPRSGEVAMSDHCFATGWGKDKYGSSGQYQVILKKIELPIVPHSKCQDLLRKTRLGEMFRLDKSFICAGGVDGRDTCKGDGGGPLVCPDAKIPGQYVQTGIVGWGIGCGDQEIPGVYGDVSKFRDWIDTTLLRLKLDTKSYAL